MIETAFHEMRGYESAVVASLSGELTFQDSTVSLSAKGESAGSRLGRRVRSVNRANKAVKIPVGDACRDNASYRSS
jgi:hypothetical protein